MVAPTWPLISSPITGIFFSANFFDHDSSEQINEGIQLIQTRALENRIPILAVNVSNHRFGGNSVIVDLFEKDKVMIPKLISKARLVLP